LSNGIVDLWRRNCHECHGGLANEKIQTDLMMETVAKSISHCLVVCRSGGLKNPWFVEAKLQRIGEEESGGSIFNGFGGK
jgi:hypothetical protein